MLKFDGENSYPDCRQCGSCCELNIIAMTPEEVARIRAYLEETGIQPIDQGKERCVFQLPDRRCSVWEVRAQTCRLHNCHVPRVQVLAENPDIVVPDDMPLIDLHECFINGDGSDPRYR